MAKLFVIKSIEQEDVDKREEIRVSLEAVFKKYLHGNIRVDTSRFFPDEFTILKDDNEIARINLQHHIVGIATSLMPAWLAEAIADIENSDHVEFDVYLNNEKN